MDSLIPVINKLQDAFSVTGLNTGSEFIQLPQIVVIGTQSSGKSSVLESLVGRSFLPRGSGIVTRCPIILQLININENDEEAQRIRVREGAEEWCIFLHNQNNIFTDFDKVREEIERETNKLAGKNRGICHEPISLKVYSKDVVQLTVVDLPGLVKVASGDQPEDIEDQIKNLVMSYINNPNSIILAVSPANNDLATSESLKYAKIADPSGARTLAVITKLDLMDEGTNAVDVLCGRVLPVKLGIIGVRNRSQQDIIDNKSIAAGIQTEAAFLKRNYPLLASTNGTPYLSKRLNRLLMDHICKCLPNLESRIRKMIDESHRTLSSLKDSDENKTSILSEVFFKFNTAYCAAIQGRLRNIDTTRLCGGALINLAFDKTLGEDLNKVHPIKAITNEEILITIRNSRSTESRLFIPEDALHDLVKRHIHSLLKPALDCALAVDSALKHIIDDCLILPEIQPYMSRFPVLQATLSALVRDLVSERLSFAEDQLQNYIRIQESFVFTAQKDYISKLDQLKSIDTMAPRFTPEQIISSRGNMPAVNASSGYATAEDDDSDAEVENSDASEQGNSKSFSLRMTSGSITLNKSQLVQCDVSRKLMESYFEVVKNAVHDYVPKALAHFMMYYMVDNLQTHLHTAWNSYSDDKLERVLQESATIAMQRAAATNMLEVLQTASDSIAEVRETNL